MEPQQAKKRGISTGFIVFAAITGVFVIFIFGVAVGMMAAKEPKTAAAPTTTAPFAPVPTTPATEPATTAAPYVPVPADFTIEVIEVERSCFGSAGCNVKYTINPTYNGPAAPGTFQVIFDVAGAEGAKTGNFTVFSGQARSDGETELVQVPTGSVLTATATRVLPT